MRLNKFYLILLTLAVIPTHSFAFFCPSNFSQIDLGNTIEQVQQTCGKPDKQETKDGEASGPQLWDYYVPQSGGMGNPNQAQGTLKTTIAFDGNNKVVNISVNGIGVASSNLCGKSISLGATRDEVKSACGTPGFITKQDASASSDTGGAKPADKITTFTYNSSPPVTLTFTNGILTGKD